MCTSFFHVHKTDNYCGTVTQVLKGMQGGLTVGSLNQNVVTHAKDRSLTTLMWKDRYIDE